MPQSATTDSTARNSHTRVDPSHVVPVAIPDLDSPAHALPSHDLLTAVAGRNPSVQPEQIQRQADTLGNLLQTQRRDQDKREAEFNARAARMENELRTARLVYRERELSLQEKQENFQHSLDQLRERNADMVAAQIAIEQEAAEHVELHSTELDVARLSTETWQKKLRALEARERDLQSQLAEAFASQQRADLLANEFQEAQRENESKHQQATADSRQKYEQQLVDLRERSQQLDRRQASVEQLHEDALRLYREALEIRITTEELRAELQSKVSPAELTTRIGELRRRLDDQYDVTHQKLTDRKQEVSGLIQRLDDHTENLNQQREELRGWVGRRQTEIEEQTDRLLNRERELDQKNSEMVQFRRDSKRQKSELEQEIRRLEEILPASESLPSSRVGR